MRFLIPNVFQCNKLSGPFLSIGTRLRLSNAANKLMSAMTTARHTPTAGVRKWPRDEIAGRGRCACGGRYGDSSATHAVVNAG